MVEFHSVPLRPFAGGGDAPRVEIRGDGPKRLPGEYPINGLADHVCLFRFDLDVVSGPPQAVSHVPD